MASPHCLIRARYELHKVTTKLARKKKGDERDPSYPDHSGEVALMEVAAKVANVPSPLLDRLS
jgi:hypothetical protein